MADHLRPSILFGAGLAILHLLGAIMPGGLNWGFHFLGFLSWHFSVLYVAVVLWIFYFVTRGEPEETVMKLGRLIDRIPVQFTVATIVVLLSFAILLRVQAPLLGDSFFLLKNFLQASQGVSPVFPRDEPLATLYFSSMLKALGPSTFKDYLGGFLVADLVLGVVFVVAVMFLSRSLWSDPGHRVLAFAFILVLPYTQLFLGYVETYPVVLAAVAVYLCVAIASLKGTLSFIFVPAAFLLLSLSHYLGTLLAGSLLYLTVLVYRRGNVYQLLWGYGIAAVMFAGLLAAVSFDVQRFTSWVPYSHFLSLTESSDPLEKYAQAYTLLSPFHFMDLGNLAILLAGFPLFMLFRGMRSTAADPRKPAEWIFLMTAVFPVLVFLFFVKFDLGAARDWDVFSPFAFVLALLAAMTFFRGNDAATLRASVVIVLLTLLNSFFFFFVNSDAQASVKRYLSFFDNRNLSHNGFYGATLQLSMYYRETHNAAEPLRLWEGYAQRFPDDPRGYRNILNNLSREKNELDMLRVYERWRHNDPDNAPLRMEILKFAFDAGNRNFSNDNLDAAAICYALALEIDPDNARACNNLGSVLAEQKHFDRALTMFTRALALDSAYADAHHNMGTVYLDTGSKEKGIACLKRAARLGHGAARDELARMKLSW